MSEPASNSVPVVLVPGLTCTARLYADQIPALWQFGPVTIADHRRDDSMANIARQVLAAAPPRFALAGPSMGGFIAFEIMRQAPERVEKLALLDTSSRPDAPEQTERRRMLMRLAKEGRYAEIPEQAFPIYVHRNRHGDEALKRIVREMAEATGIEAYYDFLPDAGSGRRGRRGDAARARPRDRRRHSGIAPGCDPRQWPSLDARTADRGDKGTR